MPAYLENSAVATGLEKVSFLSNPKERQSQRMLKLPHSCTHLTRQPTPVFLGFPCGSAGKESTCNVGDLGSIPGLGRFPGEGIGYPLQYSWASLVAQLVKNPPAMWETWAQSLGWEDPLEEGMVAHCSIHAWKIPCREKPNGI